MKKLTWDNQTIVICIFCAHVGNSCKKKTTFETRGKKNESTATMQNIALAIAIVATLCVPTESKPLPDCPQQFEATVDITDSMIVSFFRPLSLRLRFPISHSRAAPNHSHSR